MLAGVGKIGRIGSAGTGSAGLVLEGFQSVWATTTSAETVTIPCQNVGTFNAVIEWGDGTPNSTVTTYNDLDLAHEYATAGDHTIKITGDFPNIKFNNGGDKLKIKKVLNLGDVGWSILDRAFYGCKNLTDFTAGSTDTSAVTDMAVMFRDCDALINLDLSNFDTSSAVSMQFMFRDCDALTSIIGAEDFDITSFNSTSSLTSFVTVGKMTTAQYDALLINFEAQAVYSGLTPSFGASTYTGGGAAATARAALIASDGWTISDGGIA
jgi:surface protein